MHAAAICANTEAIHRMLTTGEFDSNDEDDRGETPLFIAVRSGEVKIVNALLDNKANVEVSNS